MVKAQSVHGCVQGEGKPSVTGMLRMWGREVGDEAGKVGRSR